MHLTGNKPRSPAPAGERDKIDRKVLLWLNTFPEKPVDTFTTESHLAPGSTGMALGAITSAYINWRDILGGYGAEYQFRVIYRIKPAGSVDKSLQADELLNRLGDWAERNPPDLGDGIRVESAGPVSQAELHSLWENGDEDHQILMKLTYEVM